MAYKTVLVHCNDKRRISSLAETAAELAHPFEAHLVGLSVTPPAAIIPSGMPGTPDTIVLDAHRVAYRRDNGAMRATFEASARKASLSARQLAVDALPRRCRPAGGGEWAPGADRGEWGPTARLRQEGSRCLECPARGR